MARALSIFIALLPVHFCQICDNDKSFLICGEASVAIPRFAA